MRYVNRLLAEIWERLNRLSSDQVIHQTRKLNEEAYYRQLDAFRSQFPGEYVALVDGKMVDHDKSLSALAERIAKIQPDPAKRFYAKTDVDYKRKTTIL